MERVAFMLEDSGERIGCLLNPASLVIRRSAGVQPRRSVSGVLSGAAQQDTPVLFTGGGRTVLELDLLFDISIAGSSVTTGDVRDLTSPLARLAENATDSDHYAELPRVRFVWGKAWNIPGVVIAVSERFDRFAPTGVPERSWMRIRFLRVNENPHPGPAAPGLGANRLLPQGQQLDLAALSNLNVPDENVQIHETRGGGASGGAGDRLDQLAAKYYGDPALWRLIAAFNNIADPLHILSGFVLRIPPLLSSVKASVKKEL
jgi:hypothetical protein